MPHPAVTPARKVLLDDESIRRTLSRIAHEIIERNEELDTVALVGTSGSAELDEKVESALRNLRTETAPTELLGREVTFTLGEPGPQPAVAAR